MYVFYVSLLLFMLLCVYHYMLACVQFVALAFDVVDAIKCICYQNMSSRPLILSAIYVLL